jgi:hypothetical protein
VAAAHQRPPIPAGSPAPPCTRTCGPGRSRACRCSACQAMSAPERNGGGGRQMIHRSGLGSQVGGRGGDILGGGTGAVKTDQAVDVVAGAPAADPATRRSHRLDRSWQGIAVAQTSASSLPGPGAGDGNILAGQAVRIGAGGAERRARPGRDPRHAAGVPRPGWFETHVAHGSSRTVRCVNATGGMARQSGLISWANR